MINASANSKYDPFKFKLQEEKLAGITNPHNFNKTKMHISDSNEEKQNLTLNSKPLEEGVINNLNITNEFSSNIYLKKIIDGFKEEISTLKNYIIRINNELVKNNITLTTPNVIKQEIEETNDYDKFINDSCKKLLNFKYINPLLDMYDNHLINVEKELKNVTMQLSKYEGRIKELTNENSILREQLEVKNIELKQIFDKKLVSSNQVVYDEEYIVGLEERSNILSRENEILLNNLQKVSQQLLEFQISYSDKYNESVEKIMVFDKINVNYEDLKIRFDQCLMKLQLTESKMNELIEKNAKLELCCENLVAENNNLRSDNKYLEGTLNILRNNNKFEI